MGVAGVDDCGPSGSCQTGESAKYLAAALDLLVLADEDGLSVFSATDLGHRLARHEMQIANLSSSSVGNSRRAVYVHTTDSEGTVIDLADPARPRAAARYRERPDLEDVQRVASTLVRLGHGQLAGVVMTAGPTTPGLVVVQPCPGSIGKHPACLGGDQVIIRWTPSRGWRLTGSDIRSESVDADRLLRQFTEMLDTASGTTMPWRPDINASAKVAARTVPGDNVAIH
jgi:hypothetical protein